MHRATEPTCGLRSESNDGRLLTEARSLRLPDTMHTTTRETEAYDLQSADVREWMRFESGRLTSEPPQPPSASMREGVTVAVCTFQRAASLVQLLESLPGQTLRPQRLIIVDASPDSDTRNSVASFQQFDAIADEILYFHVEGAFKTLTCSRNFALQWIDTDLMVFFDDDVVLEPSCLEEMVQPLRACPDVVGTGGYATNYTKSPSGYWQMRRMMRIVPDLKPGQFCRSGMATPWSFLPQNESWVEGQWLSGFAMMWRTEIARRVRFNEGFGGHSTGEDVDFSLRMARCGRLVVAGKARLLHLTDTGGRPNTYRMGYTGIRNSYDIHRRCLPNRTWRDGAWFAYAYGMDAVMRTVNLLAPGDRRRRWDFLRGRLRFLAEVLSGRFQLSQDSEQQSLVRSS